MTGFPSRVFFKHKSKMTADCEVVWKKNLDALSEQKCRLQISRA